MSTMRTTLQQIMRDESDAILAVMNSTASSLSIEAMDWERTHGAIVNEIRGRDDYGHPGVWRLVRSVSQYILDFQGITTKVNITGMFSPAHMPEQISRSIIYVRS